MSEHHFLSSEWVCIPAKQDVLEIVYLPGIVVPFPASSVCCIAAVGVAYCKNDLLRGRVGSLLAFFLQQGHLVSPSSQQSNVACM